MAASTREADARHRKVEHLKHVISELSISVTADDVAAWGDDQWEAATEAANGYFGANHDVPSEHSRSLVVADLAERERLAAMSDDDLFGAGRG